MQISPGLHSVLNSEAFRAGKGKIDEGNPDQTGENLAILALKNEELSQNKQFLKAILYGPIWLVLWSCTFQCFTAILQEI